MSDELNLDIVQKAFIQLAQSKGIPFAELANGWNEERECLEWNLDYNTSLQSDVDADIKRMLRYFELHRVSLEKDDLATARASLVHAAVFARTLASAFEYIHDECYKVLRDDPRFQWPEIPENYQIPDQYKDILSR